VNRHDGDPLEALALADGNGEVLRDCRAIGRVCLNFMRHAFELLCELESAEVRRCWNVMDGSVIVTSADAGVIGETHDATAQCARNARLVAEQRRRPARPFFL
jgi:hypothetical protein